MKSKEPVVLAWSGGKDSAYALYQLRQDKSLEVVGLLSTFNGNFKRLSMHGVREELIEAQARNIGIPLLPVYVYEGNNLEYEEKMKEALMKIKSSGISTIAFGDIFLEDLRLYRERQLKEVCMDCLFPLWKTDTRALVHDFISKGFRAYTCCVSDACLDESWCGKLIDESFVRELPAGLDPCGENGEFHSFCFEGPVFDKALPVLRGEKVYRPLDPDPSGIQMPAGFWYCDLQQAEGFRAASQNGNKFISQ